jgi:hypothetical protein
MKEYVPFLIYLMIHYQLGYTASNNKMIMKDEQGMIWKKMIAD